MLPSFSISSASVPDAVSCASAWVALRTADIAHREGADWHAGGRADEDKLPATLSEEADGLRDRHVGPDLREWGAHDVGGARVEQPPDVALQDVEIGNVTEGALIDDDRELGHPVLGHHPGRLGEAGVREAERKLARHRLLDGASVPNRRGHC